MPAMTWHRAAALLAAVAVLSAGVVACGQDKKPVTVGLIVKRNTNPFWVTMKDTAEDTADDDNVKLLTAAGTSDIDNRSQVNALAKMTAEGAKGIMITPANSSAIVPAIEKARRAGVTVIALDTPTQPASAVNALYATNNYQAGQLIGRYARAKAVQKGTRVSPCSTCRRGSRAGSCATGASSTASGSGTATRGSWAPSTRSARRGARRTA